jgi:nucleotide-binding universal stress UspA family protein
MLPIRTILHPTDFSQNSDWAFDLACALAKDYGARVIILHVSLPPAHVYGDGVVLTQPMDYQDELRKKLCRLQPGHPGVPMEHRLVEGDAGEAIVQLAEETKSDLIVMGTHGRTGLSRLLMGSVAEKVVRRAPCPVLTLKTPMPQAHRSKEPCLQAAGVPVAAGMH